MAKKPMTSIHDLSTGENITREMTDAEFVQYQKDLADWSAQEDARIAKESARESAFSKLGLTAEEIEAIK